jgi:eukaryotic-like serine/threonine-protein kinase
MGTQPKPALRTIFGPFEYDGSSGELRKHQTKLRLTGQALQILEVLLEHPNQVVGREELQQRLWNGTTFVDFEHGLNAAVNKLRQTLGDSAGQPRYIETIPGRGYRFIGALSYSSSGPILKMVAPVSSEPSSDRPAVEPERARRSWRQFWELPLPWRASVLVGLGLLTIAGWRLTLRLIQLPPLAPNSKAQAMRFRVAIPEGMNLSASQTFSLSPDGRTLVYHARAVGGGPLLLWAQSLDSLEPRVLTHSVLGSDAPVFWSPDSKFVAFYGDGKLKKVDFSGNPVQVIAPSPGVILGGSWNRDGTIIFGTETSGILRVGANGGEPVNVTTRNRDRGERVHVFPTFLPDGRHFLYSRQSSVAENTGVFLGSLDAKPAEQSVAMLIATPFAPQFVGSPDGNGVVLFQRETTLWAQVFDTSRLQLIGEPRRVTEHVGSARAFGFFASSGGALVHRNGLPDVRQLTWFDRRGNRLTDVGKPFDLWDSSPEISPDGTRVAVTKFDGRNIDVWVHDLARDVTQRITFDPAIDQFPIWSPDGKRIVFSSSRAGHYDLYVVGTNGESREELLYASNENKIPTSWSVDGRFLLYETEAGTGKPSIWVLPLEGIGKHAPVPLLNTQANERQGVFSPDSRWIAYVSSASGQPEVYVQPFAFPRAGFQDVSTVLVSRGGGTMPHWRADGKELFYGTADGTLMSVTMTTDSALDPGIPRSLLRLRGFWWDATADGNRFLVGLPAEQGVPPFTVVLNWQNE